MGGCIARNQQNHTEPRPSVGPNLNQTAQQPSPNVQTSLTVSHQPKWDMSIELASETPISSQVSSLETNSRLTLPSKLNKLPKTELIVHQPSESNNSAIQRLQFQDPNSAFFKGIPKIQQNSGMVSGKSRSSKKYPAQTLDKIDEKVQE